MWYSGQLLPFVGAGGVARRGGGGRVAGRGARRSPHQKIYRAEEVGRARKVK